MMGYRSSICHTSRLYWQSCESDKIPVSWEDFYNPGHLSHVGIDTPGMLAAGMSTLTCVEEAVGRELLRSAAN